METSGSHRAPPGGGLALAPSALETFPLVEPYSLSPRSALSVNSPHRPHPTSQRYPSVSSGKRAARWKPWWFNDRPIIPGPASDRAGTWASTLTPTPEAKRCEAGKLDDTALSEDAGGSLQEKKMLSHDRKSEYSFRMRKGTTGHKIRRASQ